MELIKCPLCGESNLQEKEAGIYQCKVCGGTIKDNKIFEILEILRSEPENFIGNIRYRLNLELNKEHLDLKNILNLTDKILDKEPQDCFANFLTYYAKRKTYVNEYKNYLKELQTLEINDYQRKQIAKVLLNHYESYYEDLIGAYLEKQNLLSEFGSIFEKRKSLGNLELNRKNPYLKRDLFIVSDEEDYPLVYELLALLDQEEISYWFLPLNLNYELKREEQVLIASKNTALTLIFNSKHFKNHEDLVLETYKILKANEDEALKKHGLSKTISYNLNNDNELFSDVLNFSGNLNDLASKIKNYLTKLMDKDRLFSDLLLEEAIQFRLNKQYKKALTNLDKVLNSDLSEENLKMAHLEALRCYQGLDELTDPKALRSIDILRNLGDDAFLEAYENELPCLVSSKKIYNDGLKAYQAKDFKNALTYFLKASAKNDGLAFNKLGEIYFLGKGVEADLKKGLEYYEKASSLGVSDAKRMLGMIYLLGNKVPKDEFKAFNYFKEGADLKNAFCSFKCALCYKDGIGTLKDAELSFKYLKEAAKGEILEAVTLLGKFYRLGLGTKVDEEKAMMCFTYAAQNGDFEAHRELNGF